MPIDPQIALNAQGVQIPNISQSVMQGQQMALQRQAMLQMQQERAAQTFDLQQRAQQIQQANEARQGFATAMQQGGGVEASVRDWVTKNAPNSMGLVDDYFTKAKENQQKIQDSQNKINQETTNLNNARLDRVGHAAGTVLDFANGDPTKLQQGFAGIAAHYLEDNPQDAQTMGPMIQRLGSLPPDQLAAELTRMQASAPYYQAQKAELLKPTVLAPGAVQVAGGQVTAQNPIMATGDAALDMRYQALRQKQMLGQPLAPSEQAEIASYRERKLLGPEAAAAAAANRQTATILAQMAQQGRAQAFTQAQAGRAELSNKVEQPYLDAREKVDTLKGVIEAAKGGNQMAGSVQPLMGVLGLVTAEGVKRINSTELQQVEGAGSLLEKVKGEVAGWTAGQPLSPKIQQDLSDLADMLKQSADKKYLSNFNAVKQRYGLVDEQPLISAPSSTAASAAKVGTESPEHRVWRLTGKSGAEPK